MAIYDPKELEEYGEEKVKEALQDLNRWYIDNGYDNGTWVEAQKYLKGKYKITFRSVV